MIFAADRTVGRLAKWLRALGYDTVLFMEEPDRQTLHRLAEEGRLVLTRDTRLGGRFPSLVMIVLAEDRVEDQLVRLVRRGLIRPDRDRAFTRCMVCNELLAPLDREEAAGLVPEYVFNSQPTFFSCPGCGRVYWPGTHLRRMTERLEQLAASDS